MQFGLEEAAERPLSQFSGGMRRRLDLAASLITRPPLIFLDEPTTGLDPRTRGQMWDTIRDLVAEGCTVLLTTQYLDEADQLADRIAVIDRGRKVAQGTPDELKASVGSSTLQLQLAAGSDQAIACDVVRRVLGSEPVLTPESGRINAPLTVADRAADVLIALREAARGDRLGERRTSRPSTRSSSPSPATTPRTSPIPPTTTSPPWRWPDEHRNPPRCDPSADRGRRAPERARASPRRSARPSRWPGGR